MGCGSSRALTYEESQQIFESNQMGWSKLGLKEYVAKIKAEAKEGKISVAQLTTAFTGVEAFGGNFGNEASILRQMMSSVYVVHESTVLDPAPAPENHWVSERALLLIGLYYCDAKKDDKAEVFVQIIGAEGDKVQKNDANLAAVVKQALQLTSSFTMYYAIVHEGKAVSEEDRQAYEKTMEPVYQDIIKAFLEDIFGKKESLSKADFQKAIRGSDIIWHKELKSLIHKQKKEKDLKGLQLKKGDYEPKPAANFFETMGDGVRKTGNFMANAGETMGDGIVKGAQTTGNFVAKPFNKEEEEKKAADTAADGQAKKGGDAAPEGDKNGGDAAPATEKKDGDAAPESDKKDVEPQKVEAQAEGQEKKETTTAA